MAVTSPLEARQFTPIPPEPWGRRLARVREDVAGYTLDEAVALAGNFMLTTASTVSRLEGLDSEPVGNRQGSRRQLAYVLCRAYGVNPAEFGLTANDMPPGVTIPARTADSSTIWEASVYPLRPGRNRRLTDAQRAA